MTINLIDNGLTRFYFDKFYLLQERCVGLGDSLWRTALLLIATGAKELINSVSSQILIVRGKYRYDRHPNDKDNDTSRDTSIVAHIALKIHNPELYKKVRDNLSFIISGKFTWQFAWFWAKEDYKTWRICNFYKFLFVRWDSAYSKHLFCWMIWSSGEEMPRLRKLMLKNTPKWNYLCRALLDDTFTAEERYDIENYEPRIDFIWQRDFDRVKHRLMTDEEKEYNVLDKTLLNFVYKN